MTTNGWTEVRPGVPTLPPPLPWELQPGGAPELSRLMAAMARRRVELLVRYPTVPIAADRHRAPVGELLLLWERWDYGQGACPLCGAPAFAISFGAALSSGIVAGLCTRCGAAVSRFIGGVAILGSSIAAQFGGWLPRIMPRSVPGGWAMTGPFVGIIAALQELSEPWLPDPASLVPARRDILP